MLSKLILTRATQNDANQGPTCMQKLLQ